MEAATTQSVNVELRQELLESAKKGKKALKGNCEKLILLCNEINPNVGEHYPQSIQQIFSLAIDHEIKLVETTISEFLGEKKVLSIRDDNHDVWQRQVTYKESLHAAKERTKRGTYGFDSKQQERINIKRLISCLNTTQCIERKKQAEESLN